MGEGAAGGVGRRWEGGAQVVFLGLREWRAAHPAQERDWARHG